MGEEERVTQQEVRVKAEVIKEEEVKTEAFQQVTQQEEAESVVQALQHCPEEEEEEEEGVTQQEVGLDAQQSEMLLMQQIKEEVGDKSPLNNITKDEEEMELGQIEDEETHPASDQDIPSSTMNQPIEIFSSKDINQAKENFELHSLEKQSNENAIHEIDENECKFEEKVQSSAESIETNQEESRTAETDKGEQRPEFHERKGMQPEHQGVNQKVIETENDATTTTAISGDTSAGEMQSNVTHPVSDSGHGVPFTLETDPHQETPSVDSPLDKTSDKLITENDAQHENKG